MTLSNFKKTLIIICISLTLTELCLRLFFPLKQRRSSRLIFSEQKLLQAPHTEKSITKYRKDGNALYTRNYNFDESGRRVSLYSRESDKFALFFGGSFVFGSGLKDNETLPSYFGLVNKEYFPINYAFRAFGPHHMLRQIQTIDIEKQLPENLNSGNAYFISYYFHTQRYMGSTWWQMRVSTNEPYYKLNKEKILEYSGPFSEGRKLRTFIHWLAGKFEITTYLFKNINQTLGNKEQETLCSIVNLANKELRMKLDKKLDKFYFIVGPFQKNDEETEPFYEGVKNCLSPEIIFKWIHPPEDFYSRGGKYVLDKNEDAHPNAFANKWMAERLPK